MSLISYVVPVFNNSGSLELMWSTIAGLFEGEACADDYEIVFVNDGSSDNSLDQLKAIAKRDPRVIVISFTRNFGQLPAILAGYARSTGDAIINISADLQDPPELTLEMISQWRTGNEVVIAYRSDREDGVLASVFSRMAYASVRSGNRSVPAGGFDFVLMSRKALELFLSMKGRNRFFQGDVLWAGLRCSFIPYVRRRRAVGRSQYTFAKKLKLFFDFTIDSSYVPIRLMSLCGALLAISGIGYAGVIVLAKLAGNVPFTGWAPLMVVILVTSGMLMLMLGVIGEYLWRILDEIKAKPLYVVEREFSQGVQE
ncbi:glycosyltransferase family 2 protein [Stenotrophomonas sp.]|uniref:glycosyltransferase family 2 protein n=1 Tax=Stenotrophomonas sp. TaxID=69392 RepID=UPI0028AB7F3F|nr:glycosyltransferase family 2 protein [Stenotrophomonas sp.]